MKEIKIMTIKYKDIKINDREINCIRGYFGNKYKNLQEMHNHSGNSYIYKYPSIQYKTIDNTPTIMGIEEGATLLNTNNIQMEDKITIGKQKILTPKKVEVVYTKEKFGLNPDFIEYEFISPWMALNQKNIYQYQNADEDEKTNILIKIIIGNILSCSKFFNYTIDEKLQVGIDLHEVNVNFKNTKMIAFKGRFCVNFILPDYIGIGKSCSRGFGVIKKL